MVTKQTNPWDLDAYGRDLHHLWAYWITKARGAGESDDEKIEKYTGKLALLSDKIVALCKVKALWWNASLDASGPAEADFIESLDLEPEVKAQLTKEDLEMRRQVNLARAERHFADLKREMNSADELAMLAGSPSVPALLKRRAGGDRGG